MPEKKLVIVAGGRDNWHMPEIIDAIDKYLLDDNWELVCGLAPGVDTVAKNIAEFRGIKVHEFPAAWGDLKAPGAVIKINKKGEQYNAKAGTDRNEQMARFGTHLIAIWNEESPGTKDMIERARAHGLIVRVVPTRY